MFGSITFEPGLVHTIKGPQGSGKSFALLEAFYMAAQGGQTSQIFRISHDPEGVPSIGGHFPFVAMAQALLVPGDGDFAQILECSERVICIDDVHFANHGLLDVIVCLADNGKTVYAAGNALDSVNQPIPLMSMLLAHATQVTSLHSFCTICRQPANWNVYVPDGDYGATKMAAACRTHRQETTRKILWTSPLIEDTLQLANIGLPEVLIVDDCHYGDLHLANIPLD